MKALDDLFAKGGGRGITVIVIPPMRQGASDGDQVELGTPFSWGEAIAPDGRGDEDIPLDAPSDCSSFIANLIAHLTGGGVSLPALTDDMVEETEPISPDEAGPGDLAFHQYPGQGPIDYGHVGMLMDDGETILDQSTSDEGMTGRPGVDIRPIDHPFGQGGELIFRRIPGLR
jgi:cell wall-associated NlpC family hydrolase